VDFGIARAAIRSSRTATGEIKGKLRYMPPEQITGQELDGRSDQFSLGVCFWEMCARRRLFKSEDPVGIFREITSAVVPKLAPHLGNFAPALDDIIGKMLAREPAGRYPRCRDVARDIDRYLSSFAEPIAEGEVAGFIKQISGSEIESIVQDLTPSRQNFLISYRKTSATESAKRVGKLARAKHALRGWRGAAVAAATVLLLTVAVGSLALQPWRSEPQPETAGDAATPPPAPDAATAIAEPPRAAKLSVATRPTGATVLAGPVVLGTTPIEIDTLAPGVTHTLSVEKRGYQPQEFSVALETGENKSVELTLTRQAGGGKGKSGSTAKPTEGRPAETSTELGALTLDTTPWTRVTIDNDPYGSTPVFKIKLAPGRHKLRLVNEQENIDVSKTVEIKSGQVSKLNYDLSKGKTD
ncbi:MAG: PEGA domain-containing protein, partial [Deltaproteobacteria bacterium]|nr:PEGA domain-containing protein [Deltaproteobacteria bacterium]